MTRTWSHPLESNQNLSGFSRARRPTTQEWVTSAARVWGTRGADHHHRSSIVRERGARAHLGPWEDRARARRTSGVGASACLADAPIAIRYLQSRYRVADSDCLLRSDERPDKQARPIDEGCELASDPSTLARAHPRGKRRRAAWSSLGGPSVRDVWLHVTRVGDLRRYRYRAASRRKTRNVPRAGSRRSPFPTGYVQLVSTRDELRTMKRITVRERSVKRFIEKIHNLAQRLLFRHRGELSSATTVIGADIASST